MFYILVMFVKKNPEAHLDWAQDTPERPATL